ncbi:hypothetical protein C2E21_5331 [Chlorella sorokiniana]|uniref:Transcription termination factor mitochondrial n=1 Tax=Chlorella sorokiniana TaxID=3076 RepID=A0A2P6TNQ1_CHLSO|nr:hypothetical protein C2E21_5331 [Chlorella sorokiniana]|eukprot:PRW50952.1 hypothetical protein C2E21_5331 [Chlorella sorokiniana]
MRLACVSTHGTLAAPVWLHSRVAAHGAQRHVPARRLLVCAAAAWQPARSDHDSSSSSSSSNGNSSSAGKRVKRKGSEKQPQPQLQAWLQQEQGLSAKAADQHARRLALVFGSQQAALDGLPAVFKWCRSRGLTGLQTAQLLNNIAGKQQKNVVQFATLAQPVWQLIDSYIAAHIEPLRQAGARLPKHTSLAEALCSSSEAATVLSMPPGHVEAWLAAISQQLPAAAIGRLLLGMPHVEVRTLQRNLDSLQQTLGWTAEQARQLALKQARLMSVAPGTVQAAAAWLRQLFPDAEQLAAVVSRGPLLLASSVQHLQGNADTLRQALGWQDGDSQLAAFVAAYPQPFAVNDFSSECAAHKLRLLTQVAGCYLVGVLSEGSSYLKTGLETMAAHYMLVQERAPHRLYDKAGTLHLSWVINAGRPYYLDAMCMTREQRNAFVREWPRSEEGRRLLEGLRAGSVEGWPRPPSHAEAQQRLAVQGR